METRPPLNVAIIGCGGHAAHHFRMIAAESRLCLERGLHVAVEKPPGMPCQDTERLAAAARRGSGRAMVSFNRRYLSEVLAVRRLLQAAGGAVHMAASYNKPRTGLGELARQGLTPAPLVCDAIHHVDLICWLAGQDDTAAVPVEVYAEVTAGARPGEDRHNAILRFDNGGWRTRGQRLAQDLDLEAVGGSDFDEVKHFTDCILEDRTPWSSLDDAVHTMRLAEAIRAGHRGPLP